MISPEKQLIIARMQVKLEGVKLMMEKSRKLNPTRAELLLMDVIDKTVDGWTEALQMLGER